jgi:hypothetical protein
VAAKLFKNEVAFFFVVMHAPEICHSESAHVSKRLIAEARVEYFVHSLGQRFYQTATQVPIPAEAVQRPRELLSPIERYGIISSFGIASHAGISPETEFNAAVQVWPPVLSYKMCSPGVIIPNQWEVMNLNI